MQREREVTPTVIESTQARPGQPETPARDMLFRTNQNSGEIERERER
jgi:hypothetical protein